MPANHHIFEDRLSCKDINMLKRTCDSEPDSLVRNDICEFNITITDTPFRFVLSADAVEQGGFPRSIRPDDGVDGTRLNFKADAFQRLHTTKRDRKSTRLNSSHVAISYAVICLNKKKLSH